MTKVSLLGAREASSQLLKFSNTTEMRRRAHSTHARGAAAVHAAARALPCVACLCGARAVPWHGSTSTGTLTKKSGF